ncbi:MAG: FMN-binding protein [Planctomycetota bacterium]
MLLATCWLVPGTLRAQDAGSAILQTLQRSWPDARIERTTEYLTDEQRQAAEKLAGRPVADRVAFPYRIRQGDRLLATAYVDTHTVRSLKETLLVVVHPDGRLQRVEVLKFGEPPQYKPKDKWYQRWTGKPLDKSLRIGQSIPAMSGATLTANATEECVRRLLAVHQVLQTRPAPIPKPAPQVPPKSGRDRPVGNHPPRHRGTPPPPKPIPVHPGERRGE